MACLRRCFDLFLRRIRLSDRNVVADGSGSQPGFLQHHAVSRTQAVSGHFPDIHIFYRNGAAVYIIKPHQQVDHRGFAASGGSDNRHALTRLYLQIEVLNELLLRHIGKRNVLQLHFSIHMLQ